MVIKKINSLFPHLIKAEKYEAYKEKIKQGKQEYRENVGDDKYLKRSLEVARVMERLDSEIKSLDDKYEGIKTLYLIWTNPHLIS